MKIILAAITAVALGSGAAFAEDISPLCESVGEFTVAVFEARHAGQSASEVAMQAADAGADAETNEAFAAIIDAVYALDLPSDAAKAEAQAVDFSAEMIVACEQE